MSILTEKEDAFSSNLAVAGGAGNYDYNDLMDPDESVSPWHTLSVERAFERLSSTPAGLTCDEAGGRLIEYGPNELQAARIVSPWEILFQQFKNVLIIILLSATGLSVFLGHGVEAIAIIVIVLFAWCRSTAPSAR